MNHHPYITLPDETEITYSDVKYNSKEPYITIYFETPSDKNFFNSMEIDYPNGCPKNIKGYNEQEIAVLIGHYNKIAKLAFQFAMEDSVI